MIEINNRIDLFEVILKDDLDISLSPTEKGYLDSLEDEVKEPIYILINSDSFLDQIEGYTKSIIEKSTELPTEEQQYIIRKCKERIRHLKYPSLPMESFNVKLTK